MRRRDGPVLAEKRAAALVQVGRCNERDGEDDDMNTGRKEAGSRQPQVCKIPRVRTGSLHLEAFQFR